jgi:lysozyme
MTNYINGIDVSRWQGVDINWSKVKSDGYLFSFMKATDGSAYKSQFIEMGIKQATDAKKEGLKIGYYHFAHPSDFGGLEQDARDEANYFLKTLKRFPTPDFPLVLDLEDEKMSINPKDTVTWLTTFKNVINKAGFELIIYSYKDYLDRVLPKDHPFANVPLWLARYPKEFDISKPPQTARGWASWMMWQYSDKGQVKGITHSGTDLNVMRKDFFDKY